MLFLKERVRNPAKAKNHCPGSALGGLDYAYAVRCLDRHWKRAWGLHGPTHHRQVDESKDHELRALENHRRETVTGTSRPAGTPADRVSGTNRCLPGGADAVSGIVALVSVALRSSDQLAELRKRRRCTSLLPIRGLTRRYRPISRAESRRQPGDALCATVRRR